MANQVSRLEDDRTLERVRDGLKVYDSRGKEVGKVDRVFMGRVSQRANEFGEGAATAPQSKANLYGADLARFFNFDSLPEAVRDRLLRLGFIRIDASGLFSGHRYIEPDQIANVSQDRVDLRVPEDELIRPKET